MSRPRPDPLDPAAPEGNLRAFLIINRDQPTWRIVDTIHAPEPKTAVVMARAMYGGELLTAQLYFPGDEHNDDDIASAVKPELVLAPEPQADGTVRVDYGFVLDPVRG